MKDILIKEQKDVGSMCVSVPCDKTECVFAFDVYKYAGKHHPNPENLAPVAIPEGEGPPLGRGPPQQPPSADIALLIGQGSLQSHPQAITTSPMEQSHPPKKNNQDLSDVII